MVIVISPPFQDFISLPDEMRLLNGVAVQVKFGIPASGVVTSTHPEVIQVNGESSKQVQINLKQPFTLSPNRVGETELRLKLGGLPVKTVRVKVLPDIKLYPGGQSIGVKLHAAGLLVVGHHFLDGPNQEKISPGEKSDIRLGDLIIKMNGLEMKTIDQVADIVNRAGRKNEPVEIELIRGREKKIVQLKPLFDKKEKEYRLGLYIRDSAAGVGTLTFYDPVSKKYGALGHVISDIDTQKPIIVGDGQIVRANVTSIEKGASGEPGSKRAIFFNEGEVLGNITKNSPFGIFGKMNTPPDQLLINKPMSIALIEEVKKGPAEIFTVIDGQKVERFSIEIVNVIEQKYPATKGMIIKITDPRLLEKTGGIVQGMSGSPIIQNNKIVGAVTHVFVNDPTSGYGTFIEWMLNEAEISLNQERKLKAS
ncbi:SpoIVB peptidase [Microaerobacter geothermalis]|nr:SpoIVB peptidase [Microaerobacter geothermalis]